MRCTLHCILSGVLVNKRLIQTAKIQKPVHFDRKQFDAAHANTHTVTFKLTGANSPSGYLRAFQSPPVQSSQVVNSTSHQRVNAPRHSSLNNLWAASSTGLNSLLALQRGTLLCNLNWSTFHASGAAMMKEKRQCMCLINYTPLFGCFPNHLV